MENFWLKGLVANFLAGGASDNTEVTARFGKWNELITTALRGRWGELNHRGYVFSASATAVTIPVVANNLVSVFGLYNPPDSKFNLELIDCDISQVLATTVVNAFGLYFSTKTLSAAATFTTRGTEQNRMVDASAPNRGRFYSAVTHSGTPVRIASLGQDGATSNAGVSTRHTEFEGKVIIPPGVLVSVATSTAAGTSSGLAVDMSWAEYPI